MQKKKSSELSCSVLHNTAYTSLYYAFDDTDCYCLVAQKNLWGAGRVALVPLPISGIPYPCNGNERIIPHNPFTAGSCLHCALCSAVLGSWHRLLKPMIWITFPRGWIELPETDSAQVLVLLKQHSYYMSMDVLKKKSLYVLAGYYCRWKNKYICHFFVKFFSLRAKIFLFCMYTQSMESNW